MNTKFCYCPICKVKGGQVADNPLVWYHVSTDNKNRPVTHKWSANTGRMFSLKANDDDSIW
jgi:hypothetical protein